MNTLKRLWVNDLQLHRELTLNFENKQLVGYQFKPTWLNHYTPEIVNSIVSDLIKEEMITFFDDVPKMSVNVEIQTIDDTEELHIETYHMDDIESDSLFDRDKDVTKPLHEYLGIENVICDSDF